MINDSDTFRERAGETRRRLAARMRGTGALLGIGLVSSLAACADAAPASGVDPAAIDRVFVGLEGEETPGCAVATSQDGTEVMARAYGMADLEHGIPNTTSTVFEAGSVSKQLLAAATVLLALEGRISLADDVRDYLPELPDYGAVITVRQLLNHTNGLRDWGSIAGIQGWPRTTRRHTHVHVLDIAARQSALNYPPGDFYSYTNTGYNLLAVLVERVTGQTLDDFSRQRIFEPLGMTNTQWRDDFTEIVANRSMAYRRTAEGTFHLLMPFENVYGNGGLLTTPSDLLKFTRNLETGQVGGSRFGEEMHRQGIVESGREISYASALFIGEYRGVPEVHHAGGTAGYSAFLTRFPTRGLAVAVMCNVAGANPEGRAHEVAELYLAGTIDSAIPAGLTAPPVDVGGPALEAFTGGYRDSFTGRFFTVSASHGTLLLNDAPLTPISPTRFEGAADFSLEFVPSETNGARPKAVFTSQVLDRARLEPVDIIEPSMADLADYEGAYRSEDAEVTYWIERDGDGLRSRQRYDVLISLTPAYEDAFTGFGATFIFHRDGAGRVSGFTMARDRVWNLDFARLGR